MGNIVVTETEYQYAPLRIFDLQPGLDKKVQTISHPISAWTADWRDLAHNHEMRWPLVFVSAYEDGLQVFDMMDPSDPYTVATYDTLVARTCKAAARTRTSRISARSRATMASQWCFWRAGPRRRRTDRDQRHEHRVLGVPPRRLQWLERYRWGMPNVSTAQHWDTGPEGVPKGKPVA